MVGMGTLASPSLLAVSAEVSYTDCDMVGAILALLLLGIAALSFPGSPVRGLHRSQNVVAGFKISPPVEGNNLSPQRLRSMEPYPPFTDLEIGAPDVDSGLGAVLYFAETGYGGCTSRRVFGLSFGYVARTDGDFHLFLRIDNG